MLFQIQKELIAGKSNTLSLAVDRDVKQYQKLKKEYEKLSMPAKKKLTDKFNVFLLFQAVQYNDVLLAEQLFKLHDFEKMNDIHVNAALGRMYAKCGHHARVIKHLLPIFDSGKLPPDDLTNLFTSLFYHGWLKDCQRVIDFVEKHYPENLDWKLSILLYDINMLHTNPVKQTFIVERLKSLYPQCKTSSEFFKIAQCFYAANYFQDAINMSNFALQKVVALSGLAEIQSGFSALQCLESMNEIIDILEAENIKPFPIAGSLLGLHRDGKFMDFDKDADIGIFVESYDEIFNIVSLICKDQKFIAPRMLTASKESHGWNVAVHDFMKGTAIDLFFFYKEPMQTVFGLYTPCGTLKWAFKPFELTRQALAGKEYWLPENIEQHLVEMYGENWREPIEVWDSLLNCPNLTPDSQPVAIYYGLMRLWEALQKNKTKKALNYYQTLTTRWGMRFSPAAEANIKKLLGLTE